MKGDELKSIIDNFSKENNKILNDVLVPKIDELKKKARLWDKVVEIARYQRDNQPRCDGCPMNDHCNGDICEVVVKVVDFFEGEKEADNG